MFVDEPFAVQNSGRHRPSGSLRRAICRKSHSTLIANNDELAKRGRGRDEVVIAATLRESIMENICHVQLCILLCAHNPYAN